MFVTNISFDGEEIYLLKLEKEKRKNKVKCLRLFLPSLFHRNKEIEFKIIESNENTILKIFRVKGKENFYLEIANGKVEVVYNGRRRKLKK